MRDIKETQAIININNFLADVKNPYLSCSFGKDSLVVLHLVKQIRPNMPILYVNTGVEYPSVVKLAYRLKEEWQLNLTEIKPEKTFWWVVENYGWPIGARNGWKNSKAVYKCCDTLKKKPLKKASKEYDSYIDGLTASESRTRMNVKIKLDRKKETSFYHTKNKKYVVLHPILDWRVKDVWEYIEANNIPYPDVYNQEVGDYTKLGYGQKVFGHELDRCIRVGCMVCPLPILYTPGPLAQLRIYYPKVWEMLMRKGLAKEIMERKLGYKGQNELIPIDWWLKERPCWFDKV